MSDHADHEPIPKTFRAKLTADQLKNVKVMAASRKITVREFWKEALVLHISEREEAEATGKPFKYRLVPRDAISLPVYTDYVLVEVVDAWAEKDNICKDDAIYTAFSRHIEFWASQFTGLEN